MRVLVWASIVTGLVAGVGHPLAAQIVTVDEGTFDVFVADRPTGSESFSIVGSGEGTQTETLARAQIRLGSGSESQALAPLLRTRGLAHSVSRYQLKTTGVRQWEVHVERSGERRMHASVRTEEGEREQEFRFQPDLVVLEADVAHHFHFLGIRIASGSTTVPVLVPSAREQQSAAISEGVPEGVEIAGTSISATRYTVTFGEQSRIVWYDDRMHVLRLEDPETGYVAVRRELP